ncbi:MAG: zinc-binding dehydrogenase [Candidatus Nanopelagicales bacterium]
MRSAIIEELGGSPRVVDTPEPVDLTGVVVRMTCVALSPIDIAVGAGRFALGHPPLPYVMGHEGVGTSGASQVYVAGAGIGLTADGLCADVRVVPESVLVALPDSADPVVTASLGTAGVAGWMAITQRAAVTPGETVVVRGASGAAGRIAVQAARAAGASRVIGVGRAGARLVAVEHLCDATVEEGDDLGPRIAEAAGGPVPVMIDFMWGPAAGGALTALAPGGRVVLAGGGAGTLAEVASPVMIGRRLEIRGYSNFGLSPQAFGAALLELVGLAGAGSLDVAVISVPLERAAEAWQGTRDSTGKFVIDLRAGADGQGATGEA